MVIACGMGQMDPGDVKHATAGLAFGQTRWPEGDGLCESG